jgi:hypothetical protein
VTAAVSLWWSQKTQKSVKIAAFPGFLFITSVLLEAAEKVHNPS